jgi:hypothetical protein
MSRRPFVALLVAPVLVALSLIAGCSSSAPDIRTVADFDKHPCALFTDAVFSQIVGPPYHDLAEVNATLKGSEPHESDDTSACTYDFEASGAPTVPEVGRMTVTVAHARSGSQPYAVCSAGAQTRAGGYRAEKIADGVCLSPSSDLWMKVGANYFHVVVVPQPGFTNPVEANQALSPLILTVAQGAADRIPKS